MKNIAFLAILFITLSACQSKQARPPFAMPPETTIISATFKHATVSQPGNSTRLHVYIEGDGVPFESRFVIAQDPSPTNPLMLHLMRMDKVSSLYLGRPCYFNRSFPDLNDALCSPSMWTNARYSNAVVDSMVIALREHLRAHPAQGVSLIGHSGGGTLAMLMAARMAEVDQLVTLAGNLDTAAWVRLHSYTALRDSLNPANLPALALPRHQLHFVGDKDRNIPAELGQPVLAPMGLQMLIVKNADHNCCWATHWNELLIQINQQVMN